MRSKTWYNRLKSVFPDNEPELSAILARMSVLYEDLRIEYIGASTQEKLPLFDKLDSIYRKFYFLRRSTITIVEFAGAFHMLQQHSDFATIRARFDSTTEESWKAASAYFDKKAPALAKLKALRNEFGGHFQSSTATKVLAWMDSDVVASMEVVFDDSVPEAGPRLPYAYAFVAGVFGKDRPPSDADSAGDIAAWARGVFEVITEGWEHTVFTMHSLVAHHLYPRFR